MFKGIILALCACLIWGLIFVVPQFMSSFNSVEIAIGRYTFFGILSLTLLLKARLQGRCQYSLAVWTNAFLLSLLSGYYLWVVLAIRYSSPEICALILGVSPITIAFYGNWKLKEGNLKLIILPSILILIGLIMVNAPHILLTREPLEYAFGLFFSLLSLASWSAYVVLNSRYLKNNPQIHSNDWATMQGVTTFIWVTACTLVGALIMWDQLDMGKYWAWNHDTKNFLVGCGILGLFCSWVGAVLWNKASVYLPVSLSGQLMIFETLFGVIFVYVLEQQFPSWLETGGIMLMLGAVIYGIRTLKTPELGHAIEA